jgi:hypothetical protein
MRDWREKLDAFLKFNEREILQDAGKVSAEVAQKLALDEYEKFEGARSLAEAEAPDEFEEAARRLERKKTGTPGEGGDR